ncbi:unnamed protein product, partial [Meganyctiphanes norvegica]
MLPFTSSPVESSTPPLPIADGLPCSSSCLDGTMKAKMAEGAGIGIPEGDSEEEGTSSREKEMDQVPPPPDLGDGMLDLNESQKAAAAVPVDELPGYSQPSNCDRNSVESQFWRDNCQQGPETPVRNQYENSLSPEVEDMESLSASAEGGDIPCSSLPDLCDTGRSSGGSVLEQQDTYMEVTEHLEAQLSDVGNSVAALTCTKEKDHCDDADVCLEENSIDISNFSINDERGAVGGDVNNSLGCEEYLCKDNKSEDSLVLEASGPSEDYLLHDNRQISLVACGITQCDPLVSENVHKINDDKLVEDKDFSLEENLGVTLIRQNLHQSSNPMYNKWPCCFFITQEHLPSFSIDSHGRPIGYEASAVIYPTPPGASRPGASSSGSEEVMINDIPVAPVWGQGSSVSGRDVEQIKIAKRMGLIQHLPCGTYDSTVKTSECYSCKHNFKCS